MTFTFSGDAGELQALFDVIRGTTGATLSDAQLATLRGDLEKRKTAMVSLQAAVDAATT